MPHFICDIFSIGLHYRILFFSIAAVKEKSKVSLNTYLLVVPPAYRLFYNHETTNYF